MDGLLRSLIKTVRRRLKADEEVTVEAVTRELGPGQHDEPAREQARERLVRQAASETQATWLADARRRASIRILLPAGSSVAPPFTLP